MVAWKKSRAGTDNQWMEIYKVTLSPQERAELEGVASKGAHQSQKVLNALILLNCDQSQEWHERKSGRDIASVLRVSERKVDRVKKRFVEEGLEVALNKQAAERSYDSKIDGDLEARLIALSCGAPPEGHARWSLRLLADRAVELEYVDSLSHEAVRRVLKKTNSNLGRKSGG